MGFGSGISVFLRPAYYGGIQRTGRPGTREKEIGFEGRERERDDEREREIPEFPKPLAPALRFGSMNPISRILGRSSTGERHRVLGGLRSIEESVRDAKQL